MRPFEPGRREDQAPNPAAYRATTSGVSASPTRPRIPDTLTINPSVDMIHLAEVVGK